MLAASPIETRIPFCLRISRVIAASLCRPLRNQHERVMRLDVMALAYTQVLLLVPAAADVFVCGAETQDITIQFLKELPPTAADNISPVTVWQCAYTPS